MSTGLLVREKKRKKDLQDSSHGGHLGFLIRIILAIFYLQVTLMIHSKFLVNWPFGSGGEENKIFKMVAMAAIWDFQTERFELFCIYKSPRCFLPSNKSIGLAVQEKKPKTDFQDGD